MVPTHRVRGMRCWYLTQAQEMQTAGAEVGATCLAATREPALDICQAQKPQCQSPGVPAVGLGCFLSSLPLTLEESEITANEWVGNGARWA